MVSFLGYLMSYSHQQTLFIFFKTWFNEIKIRSVSMKQAFKRIGHNYFPSVGGRGTIILLHNSFTSKTTL